MKYTVVQDNNEQTPWQFDVDSYCEGTIVESLYTGDYTLRGYEKLFVIERKGSIAEWAKNIWESRFVRELERLEDFTSPFIILEFNVSDIVNFPYSSNIPKHLWKHIKIKPDFILKKTMEFSVKYKTKILFAGNQGKKTASSLFKRIIENYGENR